MFELIGSKQPTRLPAGAAAAAAGAPAGAAGGASGAPFLEQLGQLERFVAANPEDADAALQLANTYFDVENWGGAAGAYQHYLELRPNSPDVLSDYGVSLQRLGRADEALEAFDQAQKLEPDHWQSRYNEVVVLAFDLKNYDAAEQVLDELRELQPGNPDVERLANAVAERKNAA
jgi:cytochrome c-type biogenesis protein CcmH